MLTLAQRGLKEILTTATKDAIAKAETALANAEKLTIRTAAQHQAALNEIGDLKIFLRDGTADYKARVKDPINEVRQFVLDVEKQITMPTEAAITVLDAKSIAYGDEQERIARERQAEIDEQARRDAERKQREEAAKLDAQAKRAKDPIAKQELKREAEIVRSTPVTVETRTVTARTGSASSAGLRPKENWTSELFDVDALWKAVLAGKVSRAAFMPDGKFLDAQAKAMKATMNTPINDAGDLPWPGVRAVCERGHASKPRR